MQSLGHGTWKVRVCMQLTYRYRIKDKHAQRLNAQARAINFVWNYCNETQMKAARGGRKWLTGYDLVKLVAGATKEGLDLHSHSAMRVCLQYDKSRRQQKKPWLRWRSRRHWDGCRSILATSNCAMARSSSGQALRVWLHRPLPEGAKNRRRFVLTGHARPLVHQLPSRGL